MVKKIKSKFNSVEKNTTNKQFFSKVVVIKDRRMKILFLLAAFVIAVFFFLSIASPYLNKTQPQGEGDIEKNYCSPESRSAEVCIMIYQPVCGWFNESIKCFKYPCAATYSNPCFACQDPKVEYWTDGECPK